MSGRGLKDPEHQERLERVPSPGRRARPKSTRLWCKGIPGREHDYQWGTWGNRAWHRRGQWEPGSLLACTKCGKHKQYVYSDLKTYGPAFGHVVYNLDGTVRRIY